MLNANEFRRIALGMQGAVEGAHMGHPDFRVNQRIFATLHGDLERGMVKLTREQQARFVRAHPSTFSPENGAWGRQGCTRVQLDAADDDMVGEVMTLAWQNSVRQGTARRTLTNRPIARSAKRSPARSRKR